MNTTSTTPLGISPYDLVVLPKLAHPDKDDSWRDHSACRVPKHFNEEERKEHMDIFFNGRKTARAKRFCAKCPVSGPCLQFALNNDIVGGVFGGLTEDERKALV